MKFISHRGNLDGPCPQTENRPDQINFVIESGYDCEIDLYIINREYFLGHDFPQFPISDSWLLDRAPFLWIHCKNYEALSVLIHHQFNYKMNFFYHENDFYTLTSASYIWAHPMAPDFGPKMVVVMPEKRFPIFSSINSTSLLSAYAICSDYHTIINNIKEPP